MKMLMNLLVINKMLQSNMVNKIIILLVAFLAPIQAAMIAVGVLITIDTILGILGARKIGEEITSKKFGRVLTKSLVYQLLIISSHLIETYLFDQLPLVKITLGFLSITEFLSISENFQKCTGANFIKYIKEFLDTKFRGLLKEKENGKK